MPLPPESIASHFGFFNAHENLGGRIGDDAFCLFVVFAEHGRNVLRCKNE